MAVGHVAIGALRMRSSRVKKCSEAGLLTCRIVAKCPLLPAGSQEVPPPPVPCHVPQSPCEHVMWSQVGLAVVPEKLSAGQCGLETAGL